MPDVELSTLVQKGFLQIGLDNVCFVVSIVMLLFSFQDGLDLLQIHADCDAVASICELPWLDYPYILDGNPRWAG